MVFLDIGQVNEIDNELILFRELLKIKTSKYYNSLLISQGGRITQHMVELLVRNRRNIQHNIYNSYFKDFLDKCDFIPIHIRNVILEINNYRRDAVYSIKDEYELNKFRLDYFKAFKIILIWFYKYCYKYFGFNRFNEIKDTLKEINKQIKNYNENNEKDMSEIDLEDFSNGNDVKEIKSAVFELLDYAKTIDPRTEDTNNIARDTNSIAQDVKGIVEDTNETVNEVKEIAEDTNETAHAIDYKMDQFLEKFEVFYNNYKKDQEEISKKLESNLFTDEEKNKFMKEFTEKCIEEITNCVGKTIAKKDFKREQNRLIKSLTDENWKKLSEQSQTWLTTSIITYKGIKKLDNVVDYSGVCLLITKAIEIELRKRFYKGFSNYLNKHYHEKYYEYHTSLLRYPPDSKHNYRLKKNRDCDLGRITYILCYKKDESITDEKIHQNNLNKLIEYSQPKYFKDLEEEKDVGDLLFTYGEYVDEIRREYRNPSAHTGALDKDKANDCFDYVFRKTEVLKTMLDSFDV